MFRYIFLEFSHLFVIIVRTKNWEIFNHRSMSIQNINLFLIYLFQNNVTFCTCFSYYNICLIYSVDSIENHQTKLISLFPVIEEYFLTYFIINYSEYKILKYFLNNWFSSSCVPFLIDNLLINTLNDCIFLTCLNMLKWIFVYYHVLSSPDSSFFSILH